MSDSDPGGIALAGSSRKRARTISNLTEEQIQHKRSVDRKAQRAFRQRTKDCIAHLEQQFAQVQERCAQREKKLLSLREQNKTLLRCLETIVDLASTTLSQTIDDASTSDGSESGSSTQGCEGRHQGDAVQGPDSQHTFGAQGMHSPTVSEPERRQTDLPTQAAQMQPDHPHYVPDRYSFTGGDSSYTATSTASVSTKDSHASPTESYQLPRPILNAAQFSVDPQIAQTADDASRTESFAALPTPCSTMTVDSRYYVKPTSVFAVLPSHLPSTCPLDQILLDFLSSRRDMLSSGMPIETVIGPRKPTVKAVINPELVTSVHPLSGVLAGVLSTFPYVGQTEKLAFFYLMCLTMTWQVSPTKENYMSMPTWLRPTVAQITIPHPVWIDNIPWPGVRDILIENSEDFPFQLFSDYYSQNVTVNWQFDSLDAISDMDNDAVLHSIFEKHVRNLKNWTVSPEFHTRFPEMVSAIYADD
ncbi:uncharacterized protein BCR38DRAFT_455818 [Pseudomassariella vexata]|uniref:BZIP domain-containing protein n=1 Tax=Pseudomassariella vexata TaxID=1141098 RepID=A0A1Y2EE19_9PEZI|nr:uncharacterized protein BCR38DRAFT_455818 [Pseudomassariella vexata]ORY69035.1 hypothetical protein BCR38DRAFT_455818 [Pseudomassariella vexata]